MAELDGEPATVSALEQLAVTNYGHFTSMRVDAGAVRGLSLHLQRLERDCQIVFGVDLDRDRVLNYIRRAAAGRQGAYTMRVTVFDPALGIGNMGDRAEPHVLVTTRGAGPMPSAPLTARTMSFSRDAPAVKHVGLFSQLRGRRAALRAGFDDAIYVEPDGRLSEGSTWNLGFVREDGSVVWPEAPVLPGVTMALLQEALGPTVSTSITLDDVARMRAAFATSAAVGVRPISRIDGFEFPVDDPTLKGMQDAYARLAGERLFPETG